MTKSQNAGDVVPLVSIVIVNFNGRALLDDCLRSIRQHLSVSYEIIVCDNGSTDGSVAFLRAAHPDVRVVEHERNAGFSGGNNRAAAVARGELLLLLNTDAILTGPLDSWITHLRTDPRGGVLGPRLLYQTGLLQESIGNPLTWWRLVTGWLPSRGRWTAGWRLTKPRSHPIYRASVANVPWVSGAMLLTPRALWTELGGLDEGFFMYLEDAEYCLRVRRAGYHVRYSADATVLHLEGGGRLWGGTAALEHTLRSTQYFVSVHYGRFVAGALRMLLPVALLIRAVGYRTMAFRSGPDAQRHREQAQAYARTALRYASGRLATIRG